MDSQPYPFDNETIYNKIANAIDNITTVNYTDITKTVVASVVQSSVIVGYTATETFTAGATTLVITRSVV